MISASGAGPGARPAVGSLAPGRAPAAPEGARQELLRALAAIALSPPPQCSAAAESLGLTAPSAAEHTGVFVLSAPPHASVYLGEEGMLGGEAADRVAGYWRVLGLDPPAGCDHLGLLFQLMAELGDAAAAAHSERARAGLIRAREALLWEHLWSWAPAYLGAVARLGTPALRPWARLALAALSREARLTSPPVALPLALRSAPPALRPAGADLGGAGVGGADLGGADLGGADLGGAGVGGAVRGSARLAGAGSADTGPGGVALGDWGAATGTRGRLDSAALGGAAGDSLVEALLTPIRSGLIVTREDLRAAAEEAGLGYRLGERRYTVRAMLTQDAPATLGWLAALARRWAGWHMDQPAVPSPDPRRWWAGRAAFTAAAMGELQRALVGAA